MLVVLVNCYDTFFGLIVGCNKCYLIDFRLDPSLTAFAKSSAVGRSG